MKARDAHILWTPADCNRRLLRRGDHPPGSVKVLPFLSDGDRKEAARYKRDAGEEYALMREIMNDGETLPLSFDEWEEKAESERAAAKREGVNILPIFRDADEFVTFCKEKIEGISPHFAPRYRARNARA